ncbi:hypothetical protein ZHAS_00012395 [Anopheles sinensis]|uniref:Uncharacterized protein n=1 Tax=Anopheles sinensis TaxID=74873 RepID=A0A084W2S3_ANOSI|nr:hypothetical protein ZHAS_00012395 [Anopheles sinensis]
MAQYYKIVQSDELKNYPQLNIDNGIQLVMDESTGQLLHTQNIVQTHEPLLDTQQQQPSLHALQTPAEQQHQQQLLHQNQHQIHQMQPQLAQHQAPAPPPPPAQAPTQQPQLHTSPQQATLSGAQNQQVVQIVQGIQRHGQHIILRSTDQSKHQLTLQQAQNHVFTNQTQPAQLVMHQQMLQQRQAHVQAQQSQQLQTVQPNQSQIVYSDQLPQQQQQQQSMSMTQTEVHPAAGLPQMQQIKQQQQMTSHLQQQQQQNRHQHR